MKKKTRGTPARRKKKTVALARRREARLASQSPQVVDAHVLPDPRTVGEGMLLGDLGLVEVRLTPVEEACLSEPVPVDSVRILPTGQVYAPHTEYTKLFNRAFGRMGWSIVPVGKPALAEKTVVCPYILFIHGKPVAFAQGEQEYFGKGQSYGDALESTVASALRRTAKRLGVWLELWDRTWGDAFLQAHGVKVWCEAKDGEKDKPQWRRKTDPPFYNEKGKGRREERQAPPSAGYNPEENEPITPDQRKRLEAIRQRVNRPASEVSVWLAARYGYASSKDIKRKDYDDIVRGIEGSGPLPLPKGY